MAYKDRPLTSIVDRLYIEMYYFDTQGQGLYYYNDIAITINSIGDLGSNNSLTLIFKFTVPTDFPSPDSISKISYMNLYLYNSNEGSQYQACFFITSNSDELLFGQKLSPGHDAQLMFTIPSLSFNIILDQSSSSSSGGAMA